VELKSVLQDRRAEILSRWRELTLSVYPADTVRFLKRERDRFQNPVGHATGDALSALLDGLLEDWPAERVDEALDGIVRIRAVQDLAPSRALEFVFLFKHAVRKEAGAAPPDMLAELDAAVDRLALRAFDAYMRCRERTYALRADELRRRTAKLLERAERSFGAPEENNVSTDGKGGSGA
jgi:hypothetical protein